MRRFAKSFCYAFCGVVSCLKTERNMRVHFCAAFYVFMLMPFYGFTAVEKAVILLTIGSVISAEAFNTAAEAAADAVTLEKRPELRLAKDAAAGGVLITAVFAAAVGFVLFWNMSVLKEIAGFYAEHLWAAALLALSAIVWAVLIALPCGRNYEDKNTDINNKET